MKIFKNLLIILSAALLLGLMSCSMAGQPELSNKQELNEQSENYNQVSLGRALQGRIGCSADGNFHDEDDFAATAMSLALIARAGLKSKLVHYDYSCHIWQSSAKGKREMKESALGGATRFGFNKAVFFDDTISSQLNAAVNNIAKQINASSANNRFTYVLAGPMEVAYRGIVKSNPNKRQYCTVISHSKWNDNHKHGNSHTWKDIIKTGVKHIHIKNQNDAAFKSSMNQWNWVKGTPNGSWLYSRLKAPKRSGDASDAGMVFYVLTGNQNANMTQVKKFFGK